LKYNFLKENRFSGKMQFELHFLVNYIFTNTFTLLS
jgi:hypothetical protein